MKGRTRHNKRLTEDLLVVLKCHQEASLVAFRYRTLLSALRNAYPSLTTSTSKEVLLEFLQDVIYLDRKLRKLTEGKDKENKKILSQEFQIRELGAEASLSQNIINLKKELYERRNEV